VRLCLQAGEIQQRRGFTEEQVKALLAQLTAYRAGQAPFDQPYMRAHTLDGLRAHWSALNGEGTAMAVNLALLMLDIVPHAAEPERLFSMLRWFHGRLRTCLTVDNTSQMAVIKQHYQEQVTQSAGAGSAPKRLRAAAAAVEPVPLADEGGDEGLAVSDDEADAFTGDDVDDLITALSETYEADLARGGGAAGAFDFVQLLQGRWVDQGFNMAAESLTDPFDAPATPPPPPVLGGKGDGGAGAFNVAALLDAQQLE
jgi:hypothetical protein